VIGGRQVAVNGAMIDADLEGEPSLEFARVMQAWPSAS
jgi:hypothetical protein